MHAAELAGQDCWRKRMLLEAAAGSGCEDREKCSRVVKGFYGESQHRRRGAESELLQTRRNRPQSTWARAVLPVGVPRAQEQPSGTRTSFPRLVGVCPNIDYFFFFGFGWS